MFHEFFNIFYIKYFERKWKKKNNLLNLYKWTRPKRIQTVTFYNPVFRPISG